MANDTIKKDVIISSNIGSVMKDAVGSLKGVTSGFQAAQAGMNLLTKDSKALQATLGQVTNLMAFTQGIQGVMSASSAFVSMGKSAMAALNGIKVGIAATGIGLFVVALGAIVAYWDDISYAISGSNSEAAKHKRIIESINKETESLNKYNNHRLEKILQLQIEIKKEQIQQNGLLQQELRNRIAVLEAQSKIRRFFTGGNKEIQELRDQLSKLASEYESFVEDEIVLETKLQTEQTKIQNKGIEDRRKKAEEARKKRLAEQEKFNQQSLSIQQKYSDAMQDLEDKTELEKLATQRIRAQRELQELKGYDESLYNKRLKELNAYYDAKETIENKRLEDEKKELAKKLQSDIDALTNKYEKENKLIKSYSDAQALIEKDARDQAIKQVYDDTVKEVTARQDAEYQALLDRGATPEQLATLKAEQNTELVRLNDDYNNQIAESDRALAEQKKAILDSQLNATADVMGQAASLLGEETAAGKAAAIASTTVNTYSSATKAYDSMAGIPVVGPALGAVAAGLAIASGLKNVQEIMKVKTPDGGGGGSTGGGGNSYRGATPQVQFQRSGTSQIQDAINQRNQEPLRAYVVSTEITSVQAEDRRREESNTLGD